MGAPTESPMFPKVKIFMEWINQMEDKFRKLENITIDHENCQKALADLRKMKDSVEKHECKHREIYQSIDLGVVKCGVFQGKQVIDQVSRLLQDLGVSYGVEKVRNRAMTEEIEQRSKDTESDGYIHNEAIERVL